MKLKKEYSMLLLLGMVFAGGCKKDKDTAISPVVTSISPINQATEVAVNSKISATFSVAMNPITITTVHFTLRQSSTTVAGAVKYTGTTASFTPAANLAPNTLYTATITTGVKDLLGKALDKDFTWSFTTGNTTDLTLPTITVTNPANNATGVNLNQAIVTTFGETMDQTTLTSVTMILQQGSTPISGVVTSTGTSVTFKPTTNLAPNKVYTGTINTGVKDMAGNGLASNYTFSFTTGGGVDTALPMVNATSPLNNATNVVRNKVITFIFSEAMNPTTINTTNFILKQGTTTVNGTIAYSGTTGTFTPNALLAAGTPYTATILTGAKDLAGNSLASNAVWSFTTGNSSSTLTVVDLGTARNYVILAKTAINNSATSAITGDLALSPAATSYITGLALTNATGYATSAQVTGRIYAADMAAPTPINLTTAANNMVTAYNDAAGRPSPDFTELGTGNIGGKTLAAGLYKWTNNVSIPSDVVISGSSNDVWIFQIAGNLTMSSGVKITLNGGAQAKNIFWQVAGQATLGTTTHFEGILLSMTSITFQTGASLKGRALAQTAVILDKNVITQPQ